ncbi:MAG TPA: TonB-dependent receptor [Vicinamibacteria bacterium]|nr:TonB-dependent receptor [Vicinamibacteria bacterium]
MRRLVAERFGLLCVAGALLLAAVPAFAQRTTGQIVGTVTDESGGALPGVTVSLSGPTIVGTQTSTTNEDGFYRFVALPPGAYTLTFSASGFATLKRERVRALVGGTNSEDAVLKLTQRAEEITVVGDAQVVDTQTNQVSTNYDKDWVRNAPIPRFTFFDLINAAPGVNQAQTNDSRSTSLGASTSENSYQLDGTDFTAPLTGAAWPWPNTDAIEEIEVLSLGAPAEYGNVQGAVFNVVTRQGSNSFHGDVNFYLQTDRLTDRNTAEAEDGGLPFHRDKYNDATVQLSGPIVKDKLWFLASYQYQRDYYSPVGIPADFPQRFDADRVFGKFNWQVSPKHKLMFAYHDDYYRIPCIDNACNEFTAPSTVKVEHGHNPSPNVTYTGVFSDKTYLEARVSGFYGSDHADPLLEGEPRVRPRVLDLDTGLITGGIYSWYDGDIFKTAASVKLSHFADDFLGGSHDFKFGVQFSDGGADYVGGYNDYIRTYSGVPAYGYAYLVPGHVAGKTRGVGFFADDTFRVSDRLTVNVGVRYDYNKAFFGSYPLLDVDGLETGERTAAVDKLYAWNSVSPRVGFNWKLTRDGKTALKAHYGRYYRGVITGEFDDVAPSRPPIVAFSGEYDAEGNRMGEEVISDNTNLRVDPNFKNPYTDQFIVGLERELRKDLGLSATYIYKRGENYGGWRDVGSTYVPVTYVDDQGADATGRPITVFRRESDPSQALFFLTNPSEMFSRYHGVTVQLQKRMSNNWQAVGSFVWSKATGRVGSSNLDPIDEPNSTARRFGQDPNDFVNTDGRLTYDRPATAKLQFVYQLPKGFLVGLNYTYQQGRPWARVVQLPEELVSRSSQVLAERIDGSRRVGTWSLLDLRVQKEFGGERLRLALFADGLNVFNDDSFDGIGTRLGTAAGFGERTSFVFPRRLMVGAKLKF